MPPAPHDVTITDDELTEEALAADPDPEVGADAVPLWGPGQGAHLLPGWYMPAPMAAGRLGRGWRRWVILLVVAAFLAINAYGLCSTYGEVL